VTIIVNDKLNEIIETKNFPHNHPPLKDNSIKLDIIRTSVKRKGTEDLHTKPNKIILKEIRQSGFGTDIEYSSLRLVRKSLYCARKKLFPTLPQTLEDTIDILSAEGDNITTFNHEKFCHISSDKNLILFTCKANLNLLCDSTHVFGDGTFRYAPKFFLQLYTIHVYVNKFYIPVIYCLLPFKNLEMYQYMWNEIKLLCKHLTGKELDIKNFHADFEKPAHCAVLNTFPNCKIMCCFFHLSQSFYRKIQKHYYLHSKYKEENSEVGNWLRYFYGLAFLPPSEVGDGYAQLMSIAPNIEHVTHFADYVLNYTRD